MLYPSCEQTASAFYLRREKTKLICEVLMFSVKCVQTDMFKNTTNTYRFLRLDLQFSSQWWYNNWTEKRHKHTPFLQINLKML